MQILFPYPTRTHWLISLIKVDKYDWFFISFGTLLQICCPKYEIVSNTFHTVFADDGWNSGLILKSSLTFEKNKNFWDYSRCNIVYNVMYQNKYYLQFFLVNCHYFYRVVLENYLNNYNILILTPLILILMILLFIDFLRFIYKKGQQLNWDKRYELEGVFFYFDLCVLKL